MKTRVSILDTSKMTRTSAAIARRQDHAASGFWRGKDSKRTVASPVRGVSFLEAAIVTGDAVMVVVVTLSGKKRRKIWGFVLCVQGKSSKKVEPWRQLANKWPIADPIQAWRGSSTAP